MFGMLTRGGPLRISKIRQAPHGHTTITERLLRQPLDRVVTIARFVERMEGAVGVAPSTHIDDEKHEAVLREVHALLVIVLGNVRSSGADGGRGPVRLRWPI